MSEWTPAPSRRKTPYGYIRYGGPCRDDYRNMVTYDATPQGSGLVLTLQRPAMQALLAARVRYAKRSGWSKQRIARNTVKIKGLGTVPEGRPIIMTPGTNRSCETQARLYASDRSRYASPAITGHTRGLALDVSTAQANQDIIKACLRAEGWTQTRPGDEPWHWSYGVTI